MPVAASNYEFDGPIQASGRRWVRETHTLDDGSVRHVDYLAPEGTDYDAVMTARAGLINEQLAAEEFEALINGD